MLSVKRHFRRTLSAFVTHYNTERHHHGLGGALVVNDESIDGNEGPAACRQRLGGRLKYYYREAA